MEEIHLGELESQFADLIWSKEPVSTKELVKDCEGLFAWKKTTTYTVLKRLCEKKLFIMENGIVTALVKKEEASEIFSTALINKKFGGSVPSFLASFFAHKTLSEEEAQELHNLVDRLVGRKP